MVSMPQVVFRSPFPTAQLAPSPAENVGNSCDKGAVQGEPDVDSCNHTCVPTDEGHIAALVAVNTLPPSEQARIAQVTPLATPSTTTIELPTPVRIRHLLKYLRGYSHAKTEFLFHGFTNGFRLQFEGPRVFRDSQNLKSAVDHHDILMSKISQEIAEGRIAGPFNTPPFPNLQISPLGLVPKKEPNEFRVIQHLSFPSGSSINDGISQYICRCHRLCQSTVRQL